jgi:hypothetical protein
VERVNTSKRLYIVEGPDGAGKTQLAQTIAGLGGAHYVHLGPFPRVERGLARLYVEAMLPAVLGFSDVVMDRSWLSERPYGDAFRNGTDRIGPTQRSLERLAWRCQTVVIRCLPPWERVHENFGQRPELLNNVNELREVYDAYANLQTSLPMITVDPFDKTPDLSLYAASVPHYLNVRSAGNLRSKVTLIGDKFGELNDHNPLYQWPFGSLCRSGCSQWLGAQLDEAGISERDLFWVNADALTAMVTRHHAPIVALGNEAAKKLKTFGVQFIETVHPQYHKRFHANYRYPLIDLLMEIVS